jgi:hypothetical protein
MKFFGNAKDKHTTEHVRHGRDGRIGRLENAPILWSAAIYRSFRTNRIRESNPQSGMITR